LWRRTRTPVASTAVGSTRKGKTLRPPELDIKADSADVYLGLQPVYRETLAAPLDDMWAAFADAARPYALRVDGETAGFCSINDDRELLSFFVMDRFGDRAEALFELVEERLEPVAALPSTVDPGFLSPSLTFGHRAVPVALMFQHRLEPAANALAELRPAAAADHPAATTFAEKATDLPRSFLEPYLAERIDRGELLLHEETGRILASGECRDDRRQPGHAHLGVIVGSDRRGKGLGSRLLHALVLECRRRRLEPLCSTEPDNLAARAIIHKAGFRARHRVFRVALDPSSLDRRSR